MVGATGIETQMSKGVKRYWREWRKTHSVRPCLTPFQQRNLLRLADYDHIFLPLDGRAKKSFKVLDRMGLARIVPPLAFITDAGRAWLKGWRPASPDYLGRAASALEFDDMAPMRRKA